MKFKKAQGLSLNVIILAAIALLVLIILAVVFSSRMGKFSSGLEDCGSKGGTPVTQASACGDFAPVPMKDETYKYCCLNITG